MKKLTLSVLDLRNGSRYAVVGSGKSDMSDSLIAWKPRIDEPSKPRPSSKTLWSKEEAGTVKCCITPGRSQNRTSIISTPSSLMNFRSSSELLNIRFLLDGDQRTSSCSVRERSLVAPFAHARGEQFLDRIPFVSAVLRVPVWWSAYDPDLGWPRDERC